MVVTENSPAAVRAPSTSTIRMETVALTLTIPLASHSTTARKDAAVANGTIDLSIITFRCNPPFTGADGTLMIGLRFN